MNTIVLRMIQKVQEGEREREREKAYCMCVNQSGVHVLNLDIKEMPQLSAQRY